MEIAAETREWRSSQLRALSMIRKPCLSYWHYTSALCYMSALCYTITVDKLKGRRKQ